MKPLLSATLKDVSSIGYPAIASPKLDGIRCLINERGVPVTRTLKLIPNEAIRKTLTGLKLPELDGEIIVGLPTAGDCYRQTSSGVMSFDGEPDWTFWVFDHYGVGGGFARRYEEAERVVKALGHPRVRMVPHKRVGNPNELLRYEELQLAKGYEGVMGRKPEGHYKFGRATLREGILWKLKRFSDSEATITGFVEQMHNANEATVNALGRKERSSHKENKHGKDTLGTLEVTDVTTGVAFEIGTGFTDAERNEIWNARDAWLGRVVKYKFLPVGVKERPRHPVYLGPRDD